MTWFSLGRAEGFPSNYGEQHTAATTDVLLAGLILAFVILGAGFCVTIPAYTSGKRWLNLATYSFVSLLIGALILVCSFGHGWEVGHASITSPYKPGSSVEMVGELGLHVALRGINITLRGDLRHRHNSNSNSAPTTVGYGEVELIDYNEHYSWEWDQGRFGFGPYAGRISREYRDSLIRGSPIPILITAEYFTFDGEGLRFGRHYRLAGYYAHFFMWLALACWVLSNVGFFMVVKLGAILLVCTGLAQLIAILLWSCIRNSIEIQIPFESADGLGTAILKTKYGADYVLVLFNAIICIVGGATLLVLDKYHKAKVSAVFGIDPLSLYTYSDKKREGKGESYVSPNASPDEPLATTPAASPPTTGDPNHSGAFPRALQRSEQVADDRMGEIREEDEIDAYESNEEEEEEGENRVTRRRPQFSSVYTTPSARTGPPFVSPVIRLSGTGPRPIIVHQRRLTASKTAQNAAKSKGEHGQHPLALPPIIHNDTYPASILLKNGPSQTSSDA